MTEVMLSENKMNQCKASSTHSEPVCPGSLCHQDQPNPKSKRQKNKLIKNKYSFTHVNMRIKHMTSSFFQIQKCYNDNRM